MVSSLLLAAALPARAISLNAEASAAPLPKEQRIKWWREAKFGMFIHWGLYAVPAGRWKGQEVGGAGEWIMYSGKIPVKDYAPLQAQFNPVKFDANAWAKTAKAAGMKYIVITSKHHDGFGLWDSKLTDWDVMGTPFRRDILKELAEACRRHGIKLGFYHSILDWTHPEYGERRPWDLRPELPKPNMDRYTEFMKGQLRELLTGYGDVAVVWFDGEWESPWTHERGKDLYDYVLSLAPRTLVNNRVDKGRAGMAGLTVGDQYRGDFGTPEQEVPSRGLPGVDWESCMTMNDSWGFKQSDLNWKSESRLIETLVDVASKGGNFLLNVGPTAEGLIPLASVERLSGMGRWLEANGESIYGTTASPFSRHEFKWTQKPGTLYCHLGSFRGGEAYINGIKSKVRRVQLLAKGRPAALKFTQSGADGAIRVSFPAGRAIPGHSVLKLTYQGGLEVAQTMLTQSPSGDVQLSAALADVKGSTARMEEDWIGFWTSKDDFLQWEFRTLKAGKFLVSFDYALASDNGGSFRVEVGGSRLTGKSKPTGGWKEFSSMSVGEVELPAGRHTLVVRPLEVTGGLMNLRRVSLLPAPARR